MCAVQWRQSGRKSVDNTLPLLRFHSLPRFLRSVGIKMWMAPLHLGDQTFSNVGEREGPPLLRYYRMKEHLKQQVSKLLSHELVRSEERRVGKESSTRR